MRKGIHPKLVDATVICACGNTFQTKSVKPQLKVEVCSNCHPFFTGTQRFLDTGGQVERFMRRLGRSGAGAGAAVGAPTAKEAAAETEQAVEKSAEEETTG